MGGEHVFVSPLILGSIIKDATPEKKANEKEKFLDMCFFMRDDKRRYVDINRELEREFLRAGRIPRDRK